MTVAPASLPVRSGNPGIVPPWLQQPVPPAAAGKAIAPSARGGAGDERVAREQARLDTTVEDIRGYFAGIGVRDDEGNDPTTVRFNPRYGNASYAPNAIPEYGVPADSITVGVDPRSGRSFTEAKDVVAHEWSHRIIDHLTKGRLELSPLSADVAVHETLADTFAAAYDADDWVLGEELAEPIRVMNDPEQLGHPDHVDDLRRVLAPGSEFMHELPAGNGDVVRDHAGRPVEVPDWHVIAGIPNKAASIIGDRLGRDAMAKIYLHAAREYVQPGKHLAGLASATLRSVTDLFGPESREMQVTRDAWDAVGLLQQSEPGARTGATR